MTKPLIGIVAKEKDIRFHGWTVNTVSNELREALVSAGARVIAVLPPQKERFATPYPEEKQLTCDEYSDLKSVISLCDGIVLQGGTNVFRFEEAVVSEVLKTHKPFLGICAGLNTMVRAVGGRADLLPTPHEHYHPEMISVHKIFLDPKSFVAQLVGQTTLCVNSIHQNTVYETGKYQSVGVTPDGLIEVVEMPNERFHIGVHFHPELDWKTNDISQRLFHGFIQSALNYQKNKK